MPPLRTVRFCTVAVTPLWTTTPGRAPCPSITLVVASPVGVPQPVGPAGYPPVRVSVALSTTTPLPEPTYVPKAIRISSPGAATATAAWIVVNAVAFVQGEPVVPPLSSTQ